MSGGILCLRATTLFYAGGGAFRPPYPRPPARELVPVLALAGW